MTTVTFTILNPDGTPDVAGRVHFRLVPGSYDAAAQQQTGEAVGLTDEAGEGSVELWPNESGEEASRYLVTLPSAEQFPITVPDGGGPYTLSELRLMGVVEFTPQYDTLVAFIENNPDLQGPQGEPGESGGTLSDDDPEPLGASASPGVGAEASRSDHVHVRPTAGQVGADPAGSAATAASGAASALASHAADTTAIHGITDTAALVLTGDSRLSNARTPTAHAASHASAGSDPVTPAAIGAETPAGAQTKVDTHAALTNNPHSVTKAQVGLGSATDTADADKPVSTAQQTALDLKAPIASPTFTGVPAAPTAAPGTNTTQVATTAFVQAASTTPAAHAASHQNGGADEISVAGLSGLLADGQTPLAHKTSHENGGADEISVAGLSGLLADGQTPLAHATSHKSGGSDAIRLDELAVPTADVSLNSHKLTNVTDPTAAQDAATKQYVDTVAQGLDAKASVKAATTANITLSGTQTVDGVALIAADRCLVKNQSAPAENGIYLVSAGAWTRATDMDAWAEVPSAFVFVEGGTVNADTGWTSTAAAGGTLNTTAITWTQFSSAGVPSAGTGITQTGLVFAADFASTATAGKVTEANDARLSDPRTASEATVSQGDAEAGTATDRRIWTAQRVKQAIYALVGPLIAGWTGKTTPVDADTIPLTDSAASNAPKTLTWANLKATLKTYFDTLYTTAAAASAAAKAGFVLDENASIGLDPALSADGKYSGLTRAGVAGYAQTFGDSVYLDPTDSRWEKTDANSAAAADGDARGQIGIVVGAGGSDGAACTILKWGNVRADAVFPTFTPGAPIYISETAGLVTHTQPTTTDAVIRPIGYASETGDEMIFEPSPFWFTHT